ncbi:MAG: sigma-70 family RNA polymerase sigma factor [Opitutaceae bacterium]
MSEIRSAPASALPGDTDAARKIATLTSQLAAGSEAAFRQFHAEYFDRLYHFLLVVTQGQEHVAQDALQDTLLRVARYARRFADETVFWSWLKAVARSAAHDAGRKQRRYSSLLERFALTLGSAASSEAEEDQLGEAVEAGLAKLAAEDRDLIIGKYLDGATVLDLSHQTGFTAKAVESRLLRARRELAATILKHLGRA